MLTKEVLTAEVKTLREQYAKGQEQLAVLQSQVTQVSGAVERVQGALMLAEKFLVQCEEPVPASNGLVAAGVS